MDDLSPSNLLKKAYSFHSFNLHYPPSIYSQDGLSGGIYFPSSANRISKAIKSYLPLAPLFLLSIWVLRLFLSGNTQALAPFVVAAAATFALFGVLITLNTNRRINAERNALDAIDKLWAESGDKQFTHRQEGGWLLASPSDPISTINKFNSIQIKVRQKADKEAARRNEADQGHFHLAILGSMFALQHAEDLDVFITDKESWHKFFAHYDVNRAALKRGLNQAEKLCQGIYMGVYDEDLVQAYIGADISALTTYFLPDSSTQIFQGRGNFCHRHRSDHSVSSK